jgi:hypothetical protein
MKVMFFALYFGAFVCLALAGELIKSRSPNGKFAMLLKDESTTQLIEVKSRKVWMELEEVGRPWAKDSKLVWSPDSKYFAHFVASRRGGTTEVYRQNGMSFEELKLPEFPQCKSKTNVGKQFGAGVEPKRWVNSNTLMLFATEEWEDADDPNRTHKCEQTVRIAFDPEGKASIQSVTPSESAR